MDLTFITEFYVPIVMTACLTVGYIAKKWLKDLDNKYIPTIVCIVGAVLNLAVSGITIESAVYGAVTGLASTGFHQMFGRLIEGKNE